MNNQAISRILLWIVGAGALLGGIGIYRYYLTAPELRFPEIEARWQLVTPVLILLLSSALLLQQNKKESPHK